MKNNSTHLKDSIAVKDFDIRLSNVFSIYLLKEEKITNQILKFRIKKTIYVDVGKWPDSIQSFKKRILYLSGCSEIQNGVRRKIQREEKRKH